MPWVDVAVTDTANSPSKEEIEQIIDFRRRKAKARFYADENFPSQAVEMIRKMGCRVTTVQEVNRRGHPDENHAAYALKHGLMLLTCDRDYLNEERFPLIHCPAILVFAFGPGQPDEGGIRRALACLRAPIRVPQFYDKWAKIDACRDSWTEYSRFLNGTTSRTRYRVHARTIQEWMDG